MPESTKIRVIKPEAVEGQAGQGLHRFNGISPETTGSGEILMTRVVVPPGAIATAHAHNNTHTAIYVLSGTAKTYYGAKLEEVCESGPGDFLYIPPNVIHAVANETSEPVVGIIARTPADESVTEYDLQPASYGTGST